MKILVMSDSHGHKNVIQKAIERESPELILHLGDNDRDCHVITQNYPDIPLRSVRGNCDRSSSGLDIDEFTIDDCRFIMTHGHLYYVKTGYSRIISFASSRSADVLLFGHTHVPYFSVSGNLSIINPGSIGMDNKTYAVLEHKNGIVTCEHIYI